MFHFCDASLVASCVLESDHIVKLLSLVPRTDAETVMRAARHLYETRVRQRHVALAGVVPSRGTSGL
jgi:hypothetical protein